MPRFDGARERIHQPLWDMAVRGIGLSSVINGVRLFANPNTSSEEFTNMATAGALQSDQTYVVKAIRALEFFQSLKDASAFGAYGNPQLLPALSGDSVAADADRAVDLYSLLSYGCHLTFKAGEKDQFTSQLVYTPAGMGVFGSSTVNQRNIVSNGWPSHENVLLLAKDIPIPARQGISVRLDFFPFKPITGNVPGAGAGTTAGTSGEGGEAATSYTAALDPLAYLNAFDGIKMLGVILDGIKTRDVQ
jgi:hypothetical protein